MAATGFLQPASGDLSGPCYPLRRQQLHKLAAYAWYVNSGNQTQPVATKKSNPLAFDMSGNVWNLLDRH